MSDEGMDSAIEWLHKMYEENKPKWQDSAKSKMHLVYKKH
jgi:hypothetical protein